MQGDILMAEPEVKSVYLAIINPFPTRSEQLVLRAEGMMNLGGDDKLPAADRQDALAYLLGVRPDLSNIELSRLFKVNEKTIRNDKDTIRKRMSEEITDDDISFVVSDIRRTYERFSSELAKSTKACEYGTNTKLAHLKAEMDYQLSVVNALQSLGYYPKNLGNLTKTEFIFKAHVAKGGGVNTVAVESKRELEAIEATEAKMLPGAYESDADLAIRAEFDAQFSGVPLKDAPTGTPSGS